MSDGWQFSIAFAMLVAVVLWLGGCAVKEDMPYNPQYSYSDGPDTTQKWDPHCGYNFGTGPLPDPKRRGSF